jgi:hypothetical protein
MTIEIGQDQFSDATQATGNVTLDEAEAHFLAVRLRRLCARLNYTLPEFSKDDRALINIAGSVIGALLTNSRGMETVYFRRTGSTTEDSVRVAAGTASFHVRPDLITRIVPDDAAATRTALGWQQRAEIAERNWRKCRRWAIAAGAPVEKLGDDPDTPWHEVRDRDADPQPSTLCRRAGGCVCGGDAPGVRAGCSQWIGGNNGR